MNLAKTTFSLIILLFLSILSWDQSCTAKVHHVDSQGRPNADGTETDPMRTIAEAAHRAEPGDEILIRGGVYHEQIMGGNSGREGAPITFRGTDKGKVVLCGSVRVSDWVKNGGIWMKSGLSPITPSNAFVMIDEKRMLKRVNKLTELTRESYHLAGDGTYRIMLSGDLDPNRDCKVDVYELDFAFNSGDRWGGTAKKWIVLKDLILEKYGSFAISTDWKRPDENSHWELDGLTVRYNNAEGVFHCLDDWYVHDCKFVRNRGHGCQINGARVRFERNYCAENEWFGYYEDGGCGLLIGPDESAHSCDVRQNVFENNGAADGYGCGIYLEGRSRDNRIEGNLIIGGTSSGIAFFGSSRNIAANNVLVDIALNNQGNESAAFFIGHSLEGPPTQSVGNLIAHNTVWGCSAAYVISAPSQPVNTGAENRLINNLFGNCRWGPFLEDSSVFSSRSNAWCKCPSAAGRGFTGWKESFKKMMNGTIQGPDEFVVEDPGFVGAEKGNFRLKENSPLVDKAEPLREVKSDGDGKLRPLGRFPDVGAYEFDPRDR